MTDHGEAVRIAEYALRDRPGRRGRESEDAHATVAALARAGLLARPGELAALRAVAEAARAATAPGQSSREAVQTWTALCAALDAAPAAETPSGEQPAG